MKKERYLLIADSALELIITIQVKLSLLRNIDTTLIITDRSSGNSGLINKIEQTGLFDKALYVEANHFPQDKSYRMYQEPTKGERYREACVREARDILGDFESYTGFMTSEIDYFSVYMYQAIMDTATPYLIGEGIYTFYALEENIEDELRKRRVYLLEELAGIYVYGPVLKKNTKYKMYSIPSINGNRDEYVKVLNYIYGYTPHENRYKGKLIFFEESYARDGGTDNALEFIEFLISQYGPEDILVKRHPRDVENRFREMGIDSVEPYSMPWELVVLNDDCEDCILLAANSSAVILNMLWDFCRTKVKCIMLRNIMKFAYSNNSYDIFYRSLNDLYVEQKLPVPNTRDDFIEIVNKAKKSMYVSGEKVKDT